MKTLKLFVAIFFMTAVAQAAVQTKDVAYKHEKVSLEGFLAYDDDSAEARPAVLIVHAWKGLDDYVKMRATQLAEMGYVAFAVDVYGKGIRPTTTEEAVKISSIYKKDRSLFRGRLQAGLHTLLKQKGVDKNHVAAIGYCFGGTGVIELARSGADIDGVVSFHGGLDSPTPEDGKNIKAKVLALHGADDPYVSAVDLAAFEEEMRKAGVDWELIKYGNAVHSFTHKDAGTDNSKGAAYNEKADKRSWDAMNLFFDEIFQ